MVRKGEPLPGARCIQITPKGYRMLGIEPPTPGERLRIRAEEAEEHARRLAGALDFAVGLLQESEGWRVWDHGELVEHCMKHGDPAKLNNGRLTDLR